MKTITACSHNRKVGDKDLFFSGAGDTVGNINQTTLTDGQRIKCCEVK